LKTSETNTEISGRADAKAPSSLEEFENPKDGSRLTEACADGNLLLICCGRSLGTERFRQEYLLEQPVEFIGALLPGITFDFSDLQQPVVNQGSSSPKELD
jgi:hypothetical protein